MKRIFLIAAFALALIAPAQAGAILNTGVTTAVTAQITPSFQLRSSPGQSGLPSNLLLQGTFTYGSGGTSADAWVQTSIDGGSTWTDVANFHFTTSSARFVYNLSSATNTAKDGVIGSMWRVKYTTVGTYAASTNLRVDVFVNGLTSFP